MKNQEAYEGKTVRFLGQILKSSKKGAKFFAPFVCSQILSVSVLSRAARTISLISPKESHSRSSQ